MSKKDREIIYPAGSDLMRYLNEGYAICNECGAIMYREKDPKGGCDIYECPSCGCTVDELDYEYVSKDPMELVMDERGREYLIYKNDMPPAGCRDCGGPYPYCKSSCRIYDD